MSNDRELMEMAAKAVGYNVRRQSMAPGFIRLCAKGGPEHWNPLTDDGDALRLAVKLQLEIYIDDRGVAVRTHCGLKVLENGCDEKATRKAIVAAAAAIARERGE